MARTQISSDPSGRIIVSFPYAPLLVEKIKSIDGRRWHPVEKHWSFPNTDGTLERILEVFHGREIHIDPPLQDTVPDSRTEHNGVAESAPSPPPPESITSHPKSGRNGVTIDKEAPGTLKITFAYTPLLAEKVRTIKGRKWHSEEKYWSVPYSEGTVEKILKIFEGVELHLDPALKAVTSVSSSGKDPSLAKSSSGFPTLEKGGKGGFSGKNKTPVPPELQLEDLRRELVTRKYSYKTVKGYLYFNRDFLKFSGKAASEINEGGIKDYLLYLAEEKESATATINQAINALKFYYGTLLKKKFMYEVKRPRKDKKLPVVLSQEEVAKILLSVDNLKHKAILMLVYSAGLRVGEVVRLKSENIDGKRMLIHIRDSKGRKDRYTILSETALETLKEYWREYKPEKWLFEGAKPGRYISTRTVEKIFEHACEKADIRKDVSVHNQNSFATPLLEGGTDLRYIQELLGHKDSKTTEIYTHVSTKSLGKIKSPLDDLNLERGGER